MKLSVFRRAGGFTLIELMVVMTLIVILASIGLTSYPNSVTRSKEAVLKENLFRLRDSIDQYYADKNNYPETLSSLVLERYIRTVPVDPFTPGNLLCQKSIQRICQRSLVFLILKAVLNKPHLTSLNIRIGKCY